MLNKTQNKLKQTLEGRHYCSAGIFLRDIDPRIGSLFEYLALS
jgi:hypothetical protein